MIDTQVTKIILYSYIKLIQFIFFPISLNECDNIEIAKLFKKEIPESKKRVVESERAKRRRNFQRKMGKIIEKYKEKENGMLK